MRMLEARNISVGFGSNVLLSGLCLRLNPSKIIGLGWTSGSGKTTFGRALAGLHPVQAGDVLLDGARLQMRGARLVQYLPQQALAAMNPRWKIGRILTEAGPLRLDMAQALGVEETWLHRLPHEISGGQLQRISILRALGAHPRYLIADEITAALDPVAQAQIWGQLCRLAQDAQIGILAISHDAALRARIAQSELHLP